MFSSPYNNCVFRYQIAENNTRVPSKLSARSLGKKKLVAQSQDSPRDRAVTRADQLADCKSVQSLVETKQLRRHPSSFAGGIFHQDTCPAFVKVISSRGNTKQRLDKERAFATNKFEPAFRHVLTPAPQKYFTNLTNGHGFHLVHNRLEDYHLALFDLLCRVGFLLCTLEFIFAFLFGFFVRIEQRKYDIPKTFFCATILVQWEVSGHALVRSD